MNHRKAKVLIIIIMSLLSFAILKMLIEEDWISASTALIGMLIAWYGSDLNLDKYKDNSNE